MKTKKIFILSFLYFLFAYANAQNTFIASGDIFGCRVFIKNNGQFNTILPKEKVVDYAYVNGDEQVYFNKQGVTYLLQKHYPLSHEQMEEVEHGKKNIGKPTEKKTVTVSWKNANHSPAIIPSEKQSYYFSYGDLKLKSDCYKKITYKNVYNNIDIEYVFTDKIETGIKYNVIVHPGGNINDVQIEYSGDIEKIKLKNNNIVIKTHLLDILEHAPSSFQNNQKIATQFVLKNNLVTFMILDPYDANQDLIIDPWVTNLSLTINNFGYDVDYDYLGNYYVYGGSGPFLISKYNTTGTLLWTFAGVVPSAAWTSLGSHPSYKYVGNFAVDKVTGKTYTGEGINATVGSRIVRLNASGVYDNFVSNPSTLWNECWDIGFNCSDNSIFGLGGSTTSNKSAGILNTSTGAITIQNFSGYSYNEQDVVSSCTDPSGVVFFVLTSPILVSTPLNNKLMRVNPTFNGNTWIVPSTYTSFSQANNKTNPFSGLPGGCSNGFNAIAANSSYLYYYDGLNLAAFDKLTGTKTASFVITGQIRKDQGGIAVDECNNIYVGGNGAINCFYFDGTNFIANGTIPVASTTTYKYIFDIKYYEATNSLYVSGSGFGGVYNAINSGTCSNIQLNILPICNGLSSASAVATISSNYMNPLISYTWANSSNAIISQTGNSSIFTNTVTGLVNDSYILYSQLNAPCGPIITQTFNINCICSTPTITSISGSTVICANSLNTYSVSPITGVTSYNWLLPLGWVGNSNTNIITVTSNSTSGTLSVSATNSCGSSLPLLLNISVNNPTINVNSGSICAGSAFTLSPSGATSYSYSSGTAIVNPTTTTNYTVYGNNTNGCASSITNTVTVNAIPTITLNSGSICAGSAFTLSPSGATSYSYSSGTAIVNPTSTTNYTVYGSNTNGCASSITNTVTVNAIPTITLNSGSVCLGNSFTLSPSGATSYSYSSGTAIVSPTTITNYTVYGSNTNGCASSITNTVTVNAIPTITLNSGSVCLGNSFTLSPSGATSYSYSSGTAIVNPTSTTNYTVYGSNTNGCASSITNTVTVNAIPTITINSGSVCLGSTFTLSPSGATSYTYSSGTAIVSPTATTNYTVYGSNTNGCASSITNTVIVADLPLITIIQPALLTCSNTVAILTGTSNVTSALYQWLPQSVISNTAIAINIGNYTLSVTNTITNCKNYSVTSVFQSTTNVDFSVTTTSAICTDTNGGAVINPLNGVLPFAYFWSTGNTTATLSNVPTGIYTATVSDANGCVKTTTLSIGLSVNNFSIDVGVGGTINTGSSIQLSATVPTTTTYTWQPNNSSLSCINCLSPIASPNVTTIYTLIAQDINGCMSSATLAVIVTENCGDENAINLPNAFSPNEDGANDVFCLQDGQSCVSEIALTIFNRWGEKVFETNNPSFCWDGTYKNKLLDPAVFVYYAKVNFRNGKSSEKKGNVTLLK